MSAEKHSEGGPHRRARQGDRPNGNPLLTTKGIGAGYGDVLVLWDLSLTVNHHEIIALLGENGAGKSTLLNVISGILLPVKGQICFHKEEITLLNPTRRARMGIAHVPEGRLLFSGLTVKQNLRMGAFSRRDKTSFKDDLEAIYALFPVLAERKDHLAGTLSGGEQQMCALGRGLMAKPKLLLIDELSLGLAPVVVDTLMNVLKNIHETRGLSMVLVDQDVQLGLEISHRAYVLENGRMVKSGISQDFAADPLFRFESNNGIFKV